MRIGVDIGGTKTEAVVVGDDGTVVARVRLPTGFGPDAVIASTVDAVSGLTTATDREMHEFSTIGVGIPGAVDAATGRVSHAINLGLSQLDLGAELEARLGSPVRVENDVNAAALGAFHLLEQPAEASMAYLNLGTGLAAGLVLRGELWRGARGGAGEIGHVLIDPRGPLDLDGVAGGLEAMASGSGIARQWNRGTDNTVTAVLDAAAAGDAQAIAIRDWLYAGVANAVRVLVLTVDVDLVVIGGGISALGDRVMHGVEAIFDGWAAQTPFIASLGLAERIRLLPADAPVAALGAAYLGGASWPK
jgi:predicted NBD/HSP70 family sugar kinase